MLRWFPYSFYIYTLHLSSQYWVHRSVESTLLYPGKYLCISCRTERDSMFSAHSKLEALLLWACGKAWWKYVLEQTVHLLVAGKQRKKEEGRALLQWQEDLGSKFHLSDAQSQPASFLEDCGRNTEGSKLACYEVIQRLKMKRRARNKAQRKELTWLEYSSTCMSSAVLRK